MSPNAEQDPSSRLNLDGGWSIKEEAFAYLCGLASSEQVSRLLEFGSGASTIRWALAFPQMRITAIDHDREFFEQTQRLLKEISPDAHITLSHQPLRLVWLHGRPFVSYARPRLDTEFDMVIVDGPPGSTFRGREACLYYAWDQMKVGAIAVLDDMARPAEQTIFANWQAVYAGACDAHVERVGNTLGILKKTKHVKPRLRMPAVLDSYRQALRYYRAKSAGA